MLKQVKPLSNFTFYNTGSRVKMLKTPLPAV